VALPDLRGDWQLKAQPRFSAMHPKADGILTFDERHYLAKIERRNLHVIVLFDNIPIPWTEVPPRLE
jgi:hypothetical protein